MCVCVCKCVCVHVCMHPPKDCGGTSICQHYRQRSSCAAARTAGARASASITARGASARTAGARASAYARTAGARASASMTASGLRSDCRHERKQGEGKAVDQDTAGCMREHALALVWPGACPPVACMPGCARLRAFPRSPGASPARRFAHVLGIAVSLRAQVAAGSSKDAALP